jgi:hypothetical protein
LCLTGGQFAGGYDPKASAFSFQDQALPKAHSIKVGIYVVKA